MVKLIRVDHRLLHGQVAFNWTSHLSADAILLVSDNLLSDKVRLQAVKLSRPSGVRLVVMDVDKAISNILEGKTDKYNLFIVCETVQEAAKIARAIGHKRINIGGTLPSDGKRKLERTFYANDTEIELLDNMVKDGFDIFYQMIPSEQIKDFNSLVK